MAGGNLKHITSKLDAETHEALLDFCAANEDMAPSVAVRVLLRDRLVKSKDLRLDGYLDGLRQGLHEAHRKLREVFDSVR